MSDVTLNTWNFGARRLEAGIGSRDIVTSESFLILSSPLAVYSQNAVDLSRALGLTQNFSIQQQRQATQTFEIGSRRKYTFASGRATGSLDIARLIFDGMSLLKALMRDETVEGGDNDIAVRPIAEDADIAGFGNFYINLQSSLFTKPIGLLFVMQDLGRNNVGAFFLQEAYIVAHQMNVTADSAVIGERCSVLFEGVYPLQHREGATANDELIFPDPGGGVPNP